MLRTGDQVNNGGEGEKEGDNDGEIGTKAISTQAIRERRRSLCISPYALLPGPLKRATTRLAFSVRLF